MPTMNMPHGMAGVQLWRALTFFVLHCCYESYFFCLHAAPTAASVLRSDRLIGWKGEVHSVEASLSRPLAIDKRLGCPNVSAGRGGTPDPQEAGYNWLYTYPRDDTSGPHYTHMAMVTQLPNGTFLAAWQAAALTEGKSDQHLVTCISLDDTGAHWALPQKLEAVGDGKLPLWGPTFLVDKQRAVLWLFYSQNAGSCRGGPMEFMPGGDIKGIRYNLHQHEWGQPQLILPQSSDGGIPKVTANKAIELSTGEMVMPFWRENALVGDSKPCKQLKGKPGAGVLISEDRGATWKPYGYLTTKGSWLIENALAELSDGRLMMVFRTRIAKIFVSYSEDKGRTWSAARPLASFPNPNSKVDLTRLEPHGELVLVYNDHVGPNKDMALQRQGCIKCRTHLRLAISYDDGVTWQPLASLEDVVKPTLRIHYPTLQQNGCMLMVAYSLFNKIPDANDDTEHGIKIKHVHLTAPNHGSDLLRRARS
mmetsp:Transcript_21176/g.53284  ORF Transcript_21176/g.53284 Transcript_21176/m.53284 type:complete len:478 (-) Transcript_21176:103-1536(-)